MFKHSSFHDLSDPYTSLFFESNRSFPGGFGYHSSCISTSRSPEISLLYPLTVLPTLDLKGVGPPGGESSQETLALFTWLNPPDCCPQWCLVRFLTVTSAFQVFKLLHTCLGLCNLGDEQEWSCSRTCLNPMCLSYLSSILLNF